MNNINNFSFLNSFFITLKHTANSRRLDLFSIIPKKSLFSNKYMISNAE